MVKFDNYVFFALCEYSLGLYKGTHYSRYRSFCQDFKATIQLNNFSSVEKERLFAMCGHLILLFGFDIEESMRYVGRYFLENKYLSFELPTRNIKEYYSTSFN
jgi:hypothetical protein